MILRQLHDGHSSAGNDDQNVRGMRVAIASGTLGCLHTHGQGGSCWSRFRRRLGRRKIHGHCSRWRRGRNGYGLHRDRCGSRFDRGFCSRFWRRFRHGLGRALGSWLARLRSLGGNHRLLGHSRSRFFDGGFLGGGFAGHGADFRQDLDQANQDWRSLSRPVFACHGEIPRLSGQVFGERHLIPSEGDQKASSYAFTTNSRKRDSKRLGTTHWMSAVPRS